MNSIAILVALLAAQAANPAPSLTLAEVLEKVRGATARESLARFPHGVRLRGAAELFGNPVGATLDFDAAGRFVRRVDGPIPYAIGFDGKVLWQLEFSGQPRVLELGERAEQRLIGAAITAAWLAPDAPLRLQIDEAKTTPAQVMLAFAHADGFESGTIEIDRDTWQPRRWTFAAAPSQVHSIVLGEYQDLDGVRVPRRIEQTTPGGARGLLTLASAEPLASDSHFGPPAAPRDDLRFAAEIGAKLDVEKAPTGHLLVRPKIAGRDAGWFIFDTGAGSSVLATGVARSLDEPRVGVVSALGVGGAVESPMQRVSSIELGPLRLERPIMIGLDLAFLTGPLGREIGGIIGYDVISRCVVELDLEGAAIALHDPARYSGDGVRWAPLRLPGRVPTVESKFDGGAGLMRLDTGAAGLTVLFHQPTVERLKLLEGRDTQPSFTGGVGGRIASRRGKLAWLELAGERFEDLEAGFITEPKGAFASPYAAGVVGAPLLRRSELVLDYPNARIALRKRGAAASAPSR